MTMTFTSADIGIPIEGLLTAKQSAKFVGLAYGTVLNMRSAGTFPPAIMLGPKTPRWERDDLLIWARRFKEGQR